MMKNFTLFLALIVAFRIDAQIITEVSSLPIVGDELNYRTLNNISDAYLVSGENVTWDFTTMTGDVLVTDVYAPASDGDEADLFPEADMLIQFAGANAYAKRNTTNIEIVGVASGGLVPELDEIEAQSLSAPFVVRRAPVGFDDSFSGETDFQFSMWIDPSSALGEAIGSFNPIEDSSVDSLRATFTITRSENVDGWGVAVFQDEEIEALRLVQEDQISISVELFVNTALLDTWLDVSEFIDQEALGFGDISVTNYIFLGATNKEHLLEINVDNTTEQVSGRQSADFNVGITELADVKALIFPNPVSEYIVIDGVNAHKVWVLDHSGRELNYDSSGSGRIDVSHLANGVYFLKGKTTEGQLFFNKFIKQ